MGKVSRFPNALFHLQLLLSDGPLAWRYRLDTLGTDMKSSEIARALNDGIPQMLCLYGTSLSDNMAPILREALRARYNELITVINAALSGQASRSGLEFLEERVLAAGPDAVLMEFAMNDAHTYEHAPGARDAGVDLAESAANLESLIDRVRATLPGCEIVVQTMNPAFDVPGNNLGGSRRADLPAFYQGYREVAARKGVRLIDHFAVWRELAARDPERLRSLIPDGVHPSPRANREVVVPNILLEMGFKNLP